MSLHGLKVKQVVFCFYRLTKCRVYFAILHHWCPLKINMNIKLLPILMSFCVVSLACHSVRVARSVGVRGPENFDTHLTQMSKTSVWVEPGAKVSVCHFDTRVTQMSKMSMLCVDPGAKVSVCHSCVNARVFFKF